jgi:predicted nucleic-acid-binding Zn-ribbon protein
MKFNYCCPKCQNSEIAIIEGGAFKGNIYNNVTFGLNTIYLTRYICVNCGYTENYVDDINDIEKIKLKFLKTGSEDGFV